MFYVSMCFKKNYMLLKSKRKGTSRKKVPPQYKHQKKRFAASEKDEKLPNSLIISLVMWLFKNFSCWFL